MVKSMNTRSIPGLLALLLALCTVLPLFAALEPADEAILDRDYPTAIRLYQAQTLRGGSDMDRCWVGLGTALRLSGDHKGAVEAFEKGLLACPNGRYRSRAVFRRAEALGSLGRWEESSSLWQAEAQRLLSPSRKEEMAQGYLDLAERAANPVDKSKTKDPARAAQAYTKALEIGLPPAKAWKVRLDRAQANLDAGQAEAARGDLEALAKELTRPGSGPSVPTPDGSQDREGGRLKILLARAFAKAGDLTHSRRALRELAASSASGEHAKEALLELAKSYHLPDGASDSEFERGTEVLRELATRFSHDPLARVGQLLLAQSLIQKGRHDEAQVQLKEMVDKVGEAIRQQPASRDSTAPTTGSIPPGAVLPGPVLAELLPKARVLLARSLKAQRRFEESLAAYTAFLAAHPFDADSQAAQQEVLDIQFEAACDLAAKRRYAEARKAFETFLSRYPLDGRGPDVLLRMAALTLEMEDPRGAIEGYRRVVSKSPGSNQASRAQFEIGQIYENTLRDPKSALAEYAKLDWGEYASAAMERRSALERRELVISPQKVFRTDESPAITVRTRNVRTLTVRAYRVDPEAYFSRTLGLVDLDRLDVDLIRPDNTFEHPLKGAQEFVMRESIVPLPLKGPGLWVVQAGEEELWATVAVLISDLDVVVKASRSSVFAVAWDRILSKPKPGVDILVSDGTRQITRRPTGEDGVLILDDGSIKDPKKLTVLALAQGSAASTALEPKAVSSSSLSPRGYIYTDRPAYRPGQSVHMKGILRDVQKDAYTFTPGEDVTVRVLFPSGRPLMERSSKLSDCGTVIADVSLPEGASEGDYPIHIGRAGRPLFTGSFRVAGYQIPALLLKIDLDTSVLPESEPLKAKIKTVRPDGSPVRDVLVSYQVSGQSETWTGVSDEKGEISAEIDTRELSEGTHEFKAWANEDGLMAASPFFIASVGVKPGIKVDKDVVLAQEQFFARVQLSDALGKPVKSEVSVEAIRRVSQPIGADAEVVEATQKIALDEKGQGSVGFSLTHGGSYQIRVVAKDSKGHRASAQAGLTVTAADDPVRLRILTQTDSFRAGEKIELRVISWAKETQALATIEAGRVLDHRWVSLKTGENVVEWELKESYAPNATVSLVVMDRDRIHSASREITIRHGLDLSVAADRETATPGGDVALTVKSVDHLGRPADAEVSIAVVDEALLALFPDSSQPIDHFFHQRRENTALSVASSLGTTYPAALTTLSDELLSEEKQDRRITLKYETPTSVGLILRQISIKGLFRVIVPSELETRQITVDFKEVPPEEALFRVASMIGFRPQRQRSAGRLTYSFTPGIRDGVALPSAMAPGSGVTLPSASVDALGDDQTSDKEMNAPSMPGEAAGEAEAKPEDRLEEDLDAKQVTEQSFGKDLQQALHFAKKKLRYKVNARGRRGGMSLLAGSTETSSVTGKGDKSRESGSAVNGDVEGGPRVRDTFPETAFYQAALRTGPSGESRVSFKLPAGLTRYRILARAVTAKTQVGEAQTSVRAIQVFSVDLVVPPFFVTEDEAGVQALVRNRLDRPAKALVSLEVSGPNAPERLTQEVEVPANQEARTFFRFPVGRASAWDLTLSAKAQDLSDAVRKTVPVKPRGAQHFDSSAGLLTESAVFDLKLPRADLASRQLTIRLGPGLPATIVDQLATGVLFDTQESTVDLCRRELAAFVVGALESGQPGDREARKERVQGLLRQIAADPAPESPVELAEKLDLLSRARKEGFSVLDEAVAETIRAAKERYAGADDPSKLWLLYALAAEGAADFEHVNRFLRERQTSSLRTALLALTLARMDRKERAVELASRLAESQPRDSGPIETEPGAPVDIRTDEALSSAYRLMALVAASANPRAIGLELATLMSCRGPDGFPAARSRSAACQALAAYLTTHLREEDRYRIEIKVGDLAPKIISSDELRRPESYTFSGNELPDGPVHVSLRLEGRGAVDYRAVLSGFQEGLVGVIDGAPFQVTRRLKPAPLVHRGKEVPRGGSCVVGSYNNPDNHLTQLALAQAGEVELTVWCPAGGLREEILVEESIPTGCTLVEKSLSGNYRHVRVLPGRILAAYQTPPHSGAHLSYRIAGRFPGVYTMLPTRVVSCYHPRRYAYSDSRSLEVLDVGKASADPYRMTADELWTLGKAAFEEGDGQTAWRHLNDLKTFNLNDPTLKEASRILLLLAIERKDSAAVLKHFETLKERYRDLSLPFETVFLVGQAHREMKEFEQAAAVYRGLAEASFLLEAQLAGVFEQSGELERAALFTRSLIGEYPDLSVIQSAHFGLAQLVLERAGKSDVAMGHLGRELLESFLQSNPSSPMADEATFALAESWLDVERPDLARSWAAAGERRYPKSRLKDAFLYTQGWALFESQDHVQAEKLLTPVASQSFPGGSGRASECRPLALYLIAQIRHTMGQLSEALQAYQQVSDQFADARETAKELAAKEVACPEVTRIEPGRSVKVPVTMRNVGKLEVKAYKVDLLRLYLRERSLSGITRVNLAGIRAVHETVVSREPVKLGTCQTVDLDLPFKDEGAYLVVLKGDEASCSGLVLVTKLSLSVGEDPVSGRVRVHVKREPDGRPVFGASVRVVGSSSTGISSGKTDPRGLFVADEVAGQTTVIARQGESYAFHRGTATLIAPSHRTPRPADVATLKGRVLSGLKSRARSVGQGRSQYLQREVFQNKVQGVQMDKF